MGFGWAGGAWGASQALQEMKARAHQEQLQRADQEMRRQILMQQLGASKAAEARAARDQELQEAALTLQQADAMGQGSELAPDVASKLRVTPYGVRVEDKATLPSRSLAMPVEPPARPGGGSASDGESGETDLAGLLTNAFAQRQQGASPLMTTATQSAGGRSYSTLRPTVAQMREQGEQTREREQRERLEQTISSLTPDAQRLTRLEQSGVRGLNIHDVEGAAAHQAHVARENREAEERANRINRQAHDLAVQRDERNASRADARSGQLTPSELLQAQRDALTRATADYREMVEAQGGGELLDGEGNPITPEMLAQRYFDDMLSVVGAFNESTAPAAGSNGRRVLDVAGLRQRVTQNRSGRSNVALVPRGSGGGARGVGAGPGPAAAGGPVRVETPQGSFTFPNQQAADNFRRAAGLR
jgi:hypothetical protein